MLTVVEDKTDALIDVEINDIKAMQAMLDYPATSSQLV